MLKRVQITDTDGFITIYSKVMHVCIYLNELVIQYEYRNMIYQKTISFSTILDISITH